VAKSGRAAGSGVAETAAISTFPCSCKTSPLLGRKVIKKNEGPLQTPFTPFIQRVAEKLGVVKKTEVLVPTPEKL
jgi:hypothetical protein